MLPGYARSIDKESIITINQHFSVGLDSGSDWFAYKKEVDVWRFTTTQMRTVVPFLRSDRLYLNPSEDYT